jgi:sortase A
VRSIRSHPKLMSWIERGLLLVAVLALGSYAYAYLDTRIYEHRQNQRLEAALNAQTTPATTPAPARETDDLEAFQEPEPETPETTPLEEGELLGRIEIPRIGVSAMILEGVGKKTLRRGAGHIPGTPLPWAGGNAGVAAHRDSFFRGLKDIRKNDTIRLKTLKGTYEYRVDWTEVVRPDDTHVLEDTGEATLTLVTCYPFYYVGSAPKRFIVRAERIDPEQRAGEPLQRAGGDGVE